MAATITIYRMNVLKISDNIYQASLIHSDNVNILQHGILERSGLSKMLDAVLSLILDNSEGKNTNVIRTWSNCPEAFPGADILP